MDFDVCFDNQNEILMLHNYFGYCFLTFTTKFDWVQFFFIYYKITLGIVL